MKLSLLVLSILSLAVPSFAQTERGYVGGIGGFAVSAASTSPRVTSQDWAFEAPRVAPGLFAFGDVGRINDLTPSTSQPQVATTVSTLSSTDAVDVVGLMITGGGGAEFHLAPHWALDTEYRLSRISAATPLHAQGFAFGLGYRF